MRPVKTEETPRNRDGLTTKEISEMLGITEGRVSVILNNALKKMKNELIELYKRGEL